MADLFQEVDEELRRDQLTRQWQKYGKFVIAGLVAVVLATAAVVGWREYSQSQMIKYSERFTGALSLIQEDKANEAADALAALAQDASIGYATLARFREAALKAADGDHAAAADIYDAVAKDGGVDSLYADLAALYYVLHRLEDGDPAELAERLEPLLAEDGPWRHSARELSALLALRSGDTEKATAEYTQLADDQNTPAGARARAAEMLRALKQ